MPEDKKQESKDFEGKDIDYQKEVGSWSIPMSGDRISTEKELHFQLPTSVYLGDNIAV